MDRSCPPRPRPERSERLATRPLLPEEVVRERPTEEKDQPRDLLFTPYLVIKLTAADTGSRPLVGGAEDSIDITETGSSQDVFRLEENRDYWVSATVHNFGGAAALFGLARYTVLDMQALGANTPVSPSGFMSFSLQPGASARLTFPKPFRVAPGAGSTRLTFVVQAEDLAADPAGPDPFAWFGDRHIARVVRSA